MCGGDGEGISGDFDGSTIPGGGLLDAAVITEGDAVTLYARNNCDVVGLLLTNTGVSGSTLPFEAGVLPLDDS